MYSSPFVIRFPELGAQETRVLHVPENHPTLPAGEYGFTELYCEDKHCDCRRVMINVYRKDTGPLVWATINYGWETKSFYAKWMRSSELADLAAGASLDPLNQQTEYAPALLKHFEQMVEDPAYVERFKRHYEMFKGVRMTPLRSKGKKRTPPKLRPGRKR